MERRWCDGRGWLLVATALLLACGEPEAPPARLGAVGFLPVAGANLRYATDGGGPPVIFLHGGPGIGATYFLAAPPVPGFPPLGYRWVVYDQRGSGRSTGAEDPDSLTMRRFVADLEAVRAATGRERVVLMGHSFGGLLALHYALEHPDHVLGLVLLDPDPASRALWARHEAIVEDRRTDQDRAVMASVSGTEGWEADPRALELYWVARMQAYFGRREAGRDLVLGLERDVYGNFPGTAAAVRASLGDWDLFPRLHEIEAPTLIVTGDRTLFPMEAHERLRDGLGDARMVVLDGVGHFPHMEDPDGFSEAVADFLADATAPASGA